MVTARKLTCSRGRSSKPDKLLFVTCGCEFSLLHELQSSMSQFLVAWLSKTNIKCAFSCLAPDATLHRHRRRPLETIYACFSRQRIDILWGPCASPAQPDADEAVLDKLAGRALCSSSACPNYYIFLRRSSISNDQIIHTSHSLITLLCEDTLFLSQPFPSAFHSFQNNCIVFLSRVPPHN